MAQQNPFDQFATDLGAAVPPAGQPQAFGAPPPAMYGQPPPPQGAPPPAGGGFGAPPPPAGGGYGGGAPPPVYGQPPPPMGGGMYGAPPPDMGGAPPPAQPAPPAPAADPFSGFGAPAGGAPPPPAAGMPPGAPPPQDNPFGGAPPGGVPGIDQTGSFGSQQPPPQQPPAAPDMGGMAPPPAGGAPAWGAAPGGYGAPPPAAPGAIVPAETQNNPYAQAPPPQQQPYPAQPSPFGAPPPPGGAPPAGYPAQQPPPPGQPGAPAPGMGLPGAYPPPGQPDAAPGAIVPAAPGGAPAGMDPFSVFNAQQAPPPGPVPGQPDPAAGALVPAGGAPPPPAAAAAAEEEDFWGAFSATPAAAPAAAGAAAGAAVGAAAATSAAPASTPATMSKSGAHSEDLPPGGEWYDARIFTPTLGVMFFKPQELTDSLFLNTDKALVDGLSERPVVAFIVEGSSARSAGVELGHVLLKVNGVDVKNPKEASRLIKEGPRPLPLLFYVPNTEVVVAEGEHMVKYDTRETTAPNSAKDWKPKYVVIGGIIAQPWMMNMYRSKSEYDIAVIETQARRPVSVKVKQFSLQGARIQNDWQGPQMVKYKNKLHPWKYIVVLPVARNPIKISSPNLAQLKPVHEGIRRVLLAQQRDRGSKPRPASNGAPPAPAPAQQYAGAPAAQQYNRY